MPCHDVSHTHGWPRSGSLSIAKCESKCGFCASTKDYKPASALRKHVLTHIKNDELPLTLEKSTGGRPRLQTISIVPTRVDQPELPPSGSEDPMATKPVLGNSGADESIVEAGDNSHPSLDDLLGLGSDLEPRSRLNCILEALQIRKEVDVYLRPFGQETLLLEGLSDLWTSMTKTLTSHERDTASTQPYCRSQSLWVNVERDYLDILLALRDVIAKMPSPNTYNSAKVLYVFYAVMTLSVIRRLLYDTESRRGVLGPEGKTHRSSTTRYRHPADQLPILVLPWSDKNLYALFDDVHRMRLRAYAEQEKAKESLWYSGPFQVLNLIPKFSAGRTLMEQLRDLVYQLEFKWGLAETLREE